MEGDITENELVVVTDDNTVEDETVVDRTECVLDMVMFPGVEEERNDSFNIAVLSAEVILFAADCDGFNFTSESPAVLPASRSPDLGKSLVFLSVTEAVWSAWLAIVTLMLVLVLCCSRWKTR